MDPVRTSRIARFRDIHLSRIEPARPGRKRAAPPCFGGGTSSRRPAWMSGCRLAWRTAGQVQREDDRSRSRFASAGLSVREGGFEPPRPCGHRILRLLLPSTERVCPSRRVPSGGVRCPSMSSWREQDVSKGLISFGPLHAGCS